MTTRTILIASALLATCLVSGAAHAALQGRDLDGNAATFEAYYDTVLDITWLADANYGAGSSYDDPQDALNTTDGGMTWASANAWATSLNYFGITGWRLPKVGPINNVNFVMDNDINGSTINGSTDLGWNITSPNHELAYMFYVNLGNPGAYTPTGDYVCDYGGGANPCLDNVGPFTNLQGYIYWSGTDIPSSYYAGGAFAFWMDSGNELVAAKSNGGYYAWAVHDGDVAAVPEAQTYSLMLAGLGLVGFMARRRKQIKA